MPLPPLQDDATRLAALHSYDILDTDSEALFLDFVRIAALICGTKMALVSLVDEGRQWFAAALGTTLRETPIGQSVCAHAIRQDGIFVVPDLSADTRFADNPLVTEAPHLRFYGGALLRTPSGTNIGTLCVLDQQARPAGLTDAQADALAALSRQVMTQLELRRAWRERSAAVAEKDLLMQEVDHRVKNSLATVQSLLRMQARFTTNPEAAQQLQAGAARIRSFSAMHEQLYHVGAGATVDLASYLDSLIEDRREVLAGAPQPRRILFQAEPLSWPSAEAPTMGLILIELLTNAEKYGAGAITVTLRREAGAVCLTVADEGRALPSGHDPRARAGFGMRIITGLLKSRGRGELVVQHAPHTAFTARFRTEPQNLA